VNIILNIESLCQSLNSMTKMFFFLVFYQTMLSQGAEVIPAVSNQPGQHNSNDLMNLAFGKVDLKCELNGAGLLHANGASTVTEYHDPGSAAGGGFNDSNYYHGTSAAETRSEKRPVREIAKDLEVLSKAAQKMNKNYADLARDHLDRTPYTRQGDKTYLVGPACILCSKREATTVFFPCEHKCVCDKCIRRLNIGHQSKRVSYCCSYYG